MSGSKEEQVSSTSVKGKKTGGENTKTGFMDSDFIPLNELVCAPLYALAESNQRLRAHIVDSIKSMGTAKQNGQEEIIHLNHMNIAYDQIRQESDEGYSVDNLQMQVPLLSVVPVTNLNVESAEIEFATEIKVSNKKNGKFQIEGRICSPEQRDSNFLPRVTYKMKVKSIPPTEGIMRMTDLLSTSQIAKQLDTTPVNSNGNLGDEEQKKAWQQIAEKRARMKKLKKLYQKVTDTLAEMEKLYQISNDAYPNENYQVDREKYQKRQSDITNKIMKYQDEIMELEIEYGLK